MGIRGPVARAEAGAAGRGRVPPLQDIALQELLAGVQQDLPAGEVRMRAEQGQHVLELIAKAERTAALVGAAAAPQPRGEHLVGQPVVDQPVERWLVGLECAILPACRPNSAWSPRARPAPPPATA